MRPETNEVWAFWRGVEILNPSRELVEEHAYATVRRQAEGAAMWGGRLF